MTDALAKVINRAADEWYESADIVKATFGDHIAAAVAAHMLGDAVVEQAARATKLWPSKPCPIVDCRVCRLDREAAIDAARAAIRAAVGDGEGGVR